MGDGLQGIGSFDARARELGMALALQRKNATVMIASAKPTCCLLKA
jgi:hypothetical protein